MNGYWKYVAIVCLILQTSVLAADESTKTIQQPDRTFGYTIGDVLEQRVNIQHLTSSTHWFDSIPLQREGKWVERQSALISDDMQWLVLRYQIVNAPTMVISASLPALTIQLEQEQTLQIESWSFTVSPLIPANDEQSAAQTQYQADWLPRVPQSDSTVRILQWLTVALIATVISWLLWWLWQNRYDAAHLPFARANKALRKIDRTSIDDAPEAWILIHRAFDQTAGRTISVGTVDDLTNDITWLQPMDIRIKTFYTESAMRFYSESSQTSSFDIAGFCKMLYQAEKRYVSSLKSVHDNAQKAA